MGRSAEGQYGQVGRRVLVCVAVVACAFLWLACFTHHPDDWPNKRISPNPDPALNVVGAPGAFASFLMFWYLGFGAYVALAAGTFAVGVWIRSGWPRDAVLRAAGMLLILSVVCAVFGLLGRAEGLDRPGGTLGMAIAIALRENYEGAVRVGVLLCTFCVGVLLAADEIVTALPRAARWLRERDEPAMAMAAAHPITAAAPAAPSVRPQETGVTYSPDDAWYDAEPRSDYETTQAVIDEPLATDPVATDDDDETIVLEQQDAPADEHEPDIATDDDDPFLHASTADDEHSLELPETTPAESDVLPRSYELADGPEDDEESGEVEADLEDDLEDDALVDLEEDLDDEADDDVGEAEDEILAATDDDAEELPDEDPVDTEAQRSPLARAPEREPPADRTVESLIHYELPSEAMLVVGESGLSSEQKQTIKENARVLAETLAAYNLDARVVALETGPVVTLYELELAPGIKVSRIFSLANDIARAMKVQGVRVVATLPGRDTIGIEVPNGVRQIVRLYDVMSEQEGGNAAARRMYVPLYLGVDVKGEVLVTDLTRMPHLLIAGATGSGKSVCINSIILSILMRQEPDRVKLVLIDPKTVELRQFERVPHLLCPIVTDMNRAAAAVEWAVGKMEERYALLAEAGVRQISEYNRLPRQEILDRLQPTSPAEEARIPTHLPYIVVLVDELADLMMSHGKVIEANLVRLAQKSRAVGIHLVLATQRPQATVVTGLIKANLPARVAFRVASRLDSRIVLDQNGAETLLGEGDMLFLPPGESKLLRAQGTFVSDDEIQKVLQHVCGLAEPEFAPELLRTPSDALRSDEPLDELFDQAASIVIATRRGSVSLLQRRLNIGYGRAARLIEQMALMGVVGEYKGSQAREVFLTSDEWESMREDILS